MSRYINADELIKRLKEEKFDLSYHWSYVSMIIDEMPGIDLVMCDECKYVWKHSEDVYECGAFCAMTKPNFYCADGERW